MKRWLDMAVVGVYALMLVAWFLAGYGVWKNAPGFLSNNSGGFVVAVVAAAVAGSIVGRWWAVALPFLSVPVAIAVAAAGYDTAVGYHESLGPVAAAFVIVVLFGVPAAAAGVLARWLLGRLAGHRPTAV